MITLLQSDCREKLKELEAGSVHCSPPAAHFGATAYRIVRKYLEQL